MDGNPTIHNLTHNKTRDLTRDDLLIDQDETHSALDRVDLSLDQGKEHVSLIETISHLTNTGETYVFLSETMSLTRGDLSLVS